MEGMLCACESVCVCKRSQRQRESVGKREGEKKRENLGLGSVIKVLTIAAVLQRLASSEWVKDIYGNVCAYILHNWRTKVKVGKIRTKGRERFDHR